ncbi:MAG: histidine phosphatase family protein [Xanthobacteraceae bacterium]
MARRLLKVRLCLPAMLPFCLYVFALVVSSAAPAAELAGESLVRALRDGGYKIYFRHAATEWSQDDRIRKAGDWTSCDPDAMRQLSDAGRATAMRIGEAIRALNIQVSQVLSSEYCRAAETARLLAVGNVETTRDIMNLRAAAYVGGREAVIRRAQRVLSEPVPPGTNAIIVGHGNLMQAATGTYVGEAGSGIYVVRPESDRQFVLVARLAADDWMQLAARFAGKP